MRIVATNPKFQWRQWQRRRVGSDEEECRPFRACIWIEGMPRKERDVFNYVIERNFAEHFNQEPAVTTIKFTENPIEMIIGGVTKEDAEKVLRRTIENLKKVLDEVKVMMKDVITWEEREPEIVEYSPKEMPGS